MDRTQFQQHHFEETGISCPPSILNASEKRRMDFLAGRALTKRAFEYFDLPHKDVPIGPDCVPIWPTDIRGSISHTENWAAVLISLETKYFPGVDIEATLSERAMHSVSRIVLDSCEQRAITQSGLSQRTGMAAAFSGKETLYKALYPIVGSYFGFEAARLTNMSAQGGMEFELTKKLGKGLLEGQIHKIELNVFSNQVLTWLIHK